MLNNILLIATGLMVVWTSVSATCPEGCRCSSTSTTVECNTVQFEPFGMHVFSLKIANPTKPLILKNQMFNISGLENVNTISIQNATILDIEESAFFGLPLLSTLQFISCNITSMKNFLRFSKSTNLRMLNLSNSTLSTFQNVKSEHLEELILSGNKLEFISRDNFADLPSLIYINLSNNNISTIDSQAFSKLPFLQDISLSNNNIKSLDPDLFKSNKDLLTLDLSYNPLRKFDINITADMEKLTLKSCQLEEVTEEVMANLDYLNYLDISNNTIKHIKTAFDKMHELKYIDLSNNSLTDLDFNIFRTNDNLLKIILDNNNLTLLPKFVCESRNFKSYFFSCNNCNISNLPVDTFKQFPALITLNLGNNHIISANLSAVHHLRSLIELDLSNNNITNIPLDTFSKSSALEKLNLAGNPISSIDPAIFEHNRVLKTLDLSFCALHQLWNQQIKYALSSLRELILTNNSITSLTVSDLAVINSIEVLDLTNNPLQCDRNFIDIIVWLNIHNVSLVKFKTHEEMDTIGAVIFSENNHWTWNELAKEKCTDEYYQQIIKKPTEVLDDYDYHYGEFDSDEELTLFDESGDKKQFGKDIVGMRISEIISSSQNKDSGHYSFLWPTLVFIFTSLSVLIIAVNIMLLMLRSTAIPRHINIPHIKIPQWNSSTKLKKHSGSVYHPLSEEKYDSCVSIARQGHKEHVPTHDSIQSHIP